MSISTTFCPAGKANQEKILYLIMKIRNLDLYHWPQVSGSPFLRRQHELPVQPPASHVRLRVDAVQRPLPLHEHEAEDDAQRARNGRPAGVDVIKRLVVVNPTLDGATVLGIVH